MLFKTMLLSTLLIVSHGSLEAQIRKEITPLHTFFQNNFDSTIIYHQWSSWYPYPNYYIMAKKENSVFFFTYKSGYSQIQGRYYPAELHQKFIHEEGRFKLTTPDTNRYFLPVYIHYSQRHLFWIQINSFNIWNLHEGNSKSNEAEVQDEGSDTYYLITKQSIKVKTFYAADFYEHHKPGNENRMNEIKTRNTILKIFEK